jgi:hypothetical protein
MNRSWNAGVRLEERVRACKWRFQPETYRVRIDDTRDQFAIRQAAADLGWRRIEDFLLACARYVIRHHRDLKGLRAELRQRDREDRAEKRRDAQSRKKALARWEAAHEPVPSRPRAKK